MPWPKGTPHSEETRHKISIGASRSWAAGRVRVRNKPYQKKEWLEEEYIIKQRSTAEMAQECSVSNRTIYVWLRKFNIATEGRERLKNNPAWIESIAAGQRGRTHSEATKEKMRLAKLGKPLTKEHRKKLSVALSREKNPNWGGGVGKWYYVVRQRAEYTTWRIAVFERDNYTCQECGQRGGYLEAHHKKLLIVYPELMYEIDNGQTLCLSCHRAVNHQVLQKQQMVVKLTLLECVYLDWTVGGVF